MASLTVPAHVPSVAEDCEQLRSAFKGWGTNEKLIISILGHRSAAQRKLIIETYAETFGEDLLKELDRELTNDFEKLVVVWTLDPSERDAHLAMEATKIWTKNNFVLVEIACTRSPKELVLAREAYHARYKKSLKEDVAHHTTGDHRKKISDKAYSDNEVVRILATGSKAQINATLNHYKDVYEEDSLKQLEDGDEFVALLRATIKGIVYHEHYFVELLCDAINMRGIKEDYLTRVIAMMAEVDIKIIADEYC
ncbi:hypothetical protein K7X08_002209 [Anisodus acutangulus]|uniref:Annexin n=1 Tax=Anisodus acutangulus TaxID=402998 RepID=A0A9Q1LNT6_9SOLA|nr:hypothetical protein K7X08_002209 [Anisodus acutangulus]